jgi:hypothetical protein
MNTRASASIIEQTMASDGAQRHDAASDYVAAAIGPLAAIRTAIATRAIKIAVVGERSCGKTWLIRALRRLCVERDPLWGEGVEPTCVILNSNGVPLALRLTELTGYPRFERDGADRLPFAGVVVVYDSTNYYDAVNAKYATNAAYAKMYDGDRVVRCVSKRDGRNGTLPWIADWDGGGHHRCYETSAVSGRGVMTAFVALTDALTIEPPRLRRTCMMQLLRDRVRARVLPPGMRTEYHQLTVDEWVFF